MEMAEGAWKCFGPCTRPERLAKLLVTVGLLVLESTAQTLPSCKQYMSHSLLGVEWTGVSACLVRNYMAKDMILGPDWEWTPRMDAYYVSEELGAPDSFGIAVDRGYLHVRKAADDQVSRDVCSNSSNFLDPHMPVIFASSPGASYLHWIYQTVFPLAKLLREYGFEREAFQAVVEVVSKTDILLGMHSAALTNLLFLPPWAITLEIQAAERGNRPNASDMGEDIDHIVGELSAMWNTWLPDRNVDECMFLSRGVGASPRPGQHAFMSVQAHAKGLMKQLFNR
ncbi:hypothetical protein WJX73_001211 [Symbiochloris irregularis]|uniref:Uncharacterized protein n=1 Tax=Symbiochloris irregularis TaxID=706552 RepID=A0AAW1PE86_9CHLO